LLFVLGSGHSLKLGRLPSKPHAQEYRWRSILAPLRSSGVYPYRSPNSQSSYQDLKLLIRSTFAAHSYLIIQGTDTTP
jgi:hypothetical protein